MDEKKILKERLKILSQLNGVCGREEEVVRYLKDEFAKYADTVAIDPLGNVVAEKVGSRPGPKIMLAGHADEVGMVVKNILSSGFLVFEKIGAVADKLLPAREVVILTRRGKVPGIIGAKSFHLSSANEQNRVLSTAELFIDVGASSKEQAIEAGIRIGDRIVVKQEFTQLIDEDVVSTKAVDNRVGIAILVELLQKIKHGNFSGTACVVITVQEERAFTGATYIGNVVKPDYAIVIDTMPTMDTPGSNPEFDHPVWLGKGPAFPLSYGAGAVQLTFFHAHPKVQKLIEDQAFKCEINLQYLTALGTYATDASVITRSYNGIPTATLCIPRRYSHSPYEVVNISDAADVMTILEKIVLDNGCEELSFID